ncbi:MAG: polysaccharide deacetylase family protein [Deltaproteobacteria bacterium HGW-Deltaproteobacteria-19]|nr:MAG: polysaccharide deacetylase family protein [Deltaproteobacteria bacterium HGW-Deltaproteobacteria-19]
MKAVRSPWSPAHWTGVVSLLSAAVAGSMEPLWAAGPLAVFLMLCGTLPFFHRSSFFLPVISKGNPGKNAVSLTFDDGPDPQVTPRILELLAAAGVPAAFFVTGERAARHPELIRAILAAGHEVGNHSWHHDPLLMLRPMSVLRREVEEAQRIFSEAGIRPRAFRPPVGITNPRLPIVLRESDMICVTFSRRGADWGNRRVTGLAGRLLRGLRPGDILLLHDVSPSGTGGVDRWLAEVGILLRGLRERSFGIVLLSDLIGQSVMERTSGSGKKGFDPAGQE